MRCDAEQHLRITSGFIQKSEHGPLVELEKTPDREASPPKRLRVLGGASSAFRAPDSLPTDTV